MLQRALNDLEAVEPPSPELAAKIKTVSERAALFRIAACAMVNVSCTIFVNVIVQVKISNEWGVINSSAKKNLCKPSMFANGHDQV